MWSRGQPVESQPATQNIKTFLIKLEILENKPRFGYLISESEGKSESPLSGKSYLFPCGRDHDRDKQPADRRPPGHQWTDPSCLSWASWTWSGKHWERGASCDISLVGSSSWHSEPTGRPPDIARSDIHQRGDGELTLYGIWNLLMRSKSRNILRTHLRVLLSWYLVSLNL